VQLGCLRIRLKATLSSFAEGFGRQKLSSLRRIDYRLTRLWS
jgi:hypothetical protein